jgi:XTP/dITP diphosphohydrolase
MKTLVFATHNSHKFQEVSAMLQGVVSLVGLQDLGFQTDIPETGNTLQHNAGEKAQFVRQHTGLDCFADDTGLEIEALNGMPGVYSARYAGIPVDMERNIRKALAAMDGVANRRAQFRTIIALTEGDCVRFFDGIIRGTITTEQHGTGGFGYDAIFVPDGYSETFAQLSPAVKNAISHRAKAIAGLVRYLKNVQATAVSNHLSKRC